MEEKKFKDARLERLQKKIKCVDFEKKIFTWREEEASWRIFLQIKFLRIKLKETKEIVKNNNFRM